VLRDIPLKGVYKSDVDDILRDFYFPALSIARRYDRAVGYFSASTLSYAAQAMTAFVENGGRVRLIVGAFTDARDIEAVREGHRLREISEAVGENLLNELRDPPPSDLFQHRFNAMAWLVANDRLEIKVALRPNGIYHDKVGVIADEAGDAVVFSGSANESASALLPTHNYESVDVFPSWKAGLADYHRPHRESFERLWQNKSRGTAVIDLPTALRGKFLEVASVLTEKPSAERELEIEALVRTAEREELRRLAPRGPRVPEVLNGSDFEIKDHQREALNAWQSKGGFQGILDLATGAGKTITSIYGAVQMAKSIQGLVVVIAVPYQSLGDQWCEILELFNIDPIRCYVSKASWHAELRRRLLDVRTGISKFEAVVVVNRTLKTDDFQTALSELPGDKLLWIGDECHHHGSSSFASALPSHAKYRLGLSATPEHYLDDERNERLRQFYGDIVYSYPLSRAIEEGILTPYRYYPKVVELTDSESEDFIQLSDEISRMMAREDSFGAQMGQGLKAALMKRARLVGAAANKLTALEQVLREKRPELHTLFYCGDGHVFFDDDDDDDIETGVPASVRQIEVVTQLVDRLGWRVSKFTSRESRREREQILQAFRAGLIDGMVAIKCLDEGIDVPACSAAYILASSRDPRQFIQRRGRILRRSPGKDSATIHDFIVVLPSSYAQRSAPGRNLIVAELKRVLEFSSLATNRTHAYDTLRPVLQEYGLEHAL
jgi:superfamily II DNA or RNA helicase